jgi:hypothetical protein
MTVEGGDALGRSGQTPRSDRPPLEVFLLATAVAFAVIGPLTHLIGCAVVMSVLATVVTLRRIRAEVLELRAES